MQQMHIKSLSPPRFLRAFLFITDGILTDLFDDFLPEVAAEGIGGDRDYKNSYHSHDHP